MWNTIINNKIFAHETKSRELCVREAWNRIKCNRNAENYQMKLHHKYQNKIKPIKSEKKEDGKTTNAEKHKLNAFFVAKMLVL